MTALSSVLPSLGHFCIESRYADAAVLQLDAIDLSMHHALYAARQSYRSSEEEDEPGYVMQGNVSVYSLLGPMTKEKASWGSGTSTAYLTKALYAGADDAAVKSGAVNIDSPGGQVNGTEPCAIAAAYFASKKPLVACVSGMCCSAAYWVASQCSAIVALGTSQIGSIGVRGPTMLDKTAMYAMNGVKAYGLATDAFKGAGTSGTAIDAAHLANWQREIDEINQQFLEAVAKGRGLSLAEVKAKYDGRVYAGHPAMALGLIDDIMGFEDALAALQSRSGRRDLITTAAQNRMSGKEKTSEMNLKQILAARKSTTTELTADQILDAVEAAVTTEAAPLAAYSTALIAPAANAQMTELTAAVKAQGEQISAVIGQNTTIAAQNAALLQQMLAEKATAQLTADNAALDGLVRQMKLSPATAETYRVMAEKQPAQFAAVLPLLKDAAVNRTIAADRLKIPQTAGTGDAGQQLSALAAAYAKENKCGVGDAMKAVLRANPALATEHHASAPGALKVGE